ncbi:MAG TPA: hypothetical protein VML50_00105 [Anaeromyxobacter sp.]|nr:hypothetical protein [Anaeromyxobacter sp.]
MAHARSLVALALAAAATAARPAGGTRPEGTFESEGSRAEVLAGRIPVGQRIELPEGWFRVEEEGVEDGSVGSFTVMGPGSTEVAAAAPQAPPAEAPPPAVAYPTPPPSTPGAPGAACRRERSAYLRELWRESGIEVSDPEAFLEGLDAGSGGPDAGYYWFAISTDAFRNMSWSSELRSRARELIRCVRASGGGNP